MKCMDALVAGTLILLVAGCTRTPPPPSDEVRVTEPEPAASVNPEIASQNRINSVFYVAMVPKLQPCWGRISGKGDITFKYTYRRNGTTWVWQQQEVESSTVGRDQDAVALQCMQEAARDTSFPMEATEALRRSDQFDLHWTWPVPFPADVTALGRMIDTGGGSGEGCKKSCVDCPCSFTPGVGTRCSCASTCSGYTSPCTLDPDSKGCSMKLPRCATGRVGGGTVVIARAQ